MPFLQVVIDQTAKAAYVVDGTNWIGTDVPETFNMKIEAARQRGLGGLMVRWWRVCGRPWHSGTVAPVCMRVPRERVGRPQLLHRRSNACLICLHHAMFASSPLCRCSYGRLT